MRPIKYKESSVGITKDGHTMFVQDIVKDLNRKSYLETQLIKSKKLEVDVINTIANFGAWLVDNHECRFIGGEIEIAQLCSEYVEQLDQSPELMESK
ncbi:MAG: hypothetical protein Unbinned5350contig1004_31 [Prokaryotic dsDNA virus sp.]|nr:MAG: hypothetical protein Unbinned5350contig1004_31 [Prokaryotic dsDNA virus sp.]|tara:strand:+ start:841 stop:1131 length:291 start_codon:yes stop_codon:yes gene_type:complete